MSTKNRKKKARKKFKKSKLTCYGYSIRAGGRHCEGPKPPPQRIHDGVPLLRPIALGDINLRQFLPRETLPESVAPEGWSKASRKHIGPPSGGLFPIPVPAIKISNTRESNNQIRPPHEGLFPHEELGDQETSPHRGGHPRYKGATTAAPRASDLKPPPPDTSRLSAQEASLGAPETSPTNGKLPSNSLPPKHGSTPSGRLSARGLRRSGSVETRRTRASAEHFSVFHQNTESIVSANENDATQQKPSNRISRIMKRYQEARARIAAVLQTKSESISTNAIHIPSKIHENIESSTKTIFRNFQSQNARDITPIPSKSIKNQNKHSGISVLQKFQKQVTAQINTISQSYHKSSRPDTSTSSLNNGPA